MKEKSVGKLSVFFAVMGVLIFVCAAGIRRGEIKAAVSVGETQDRVLVFPESGFFEKDVSVQITAPKGAVVCYTLNCEEPDEESGKVYNKPLVLEAADEEQVYVLRARAFYADGTASEICTRTYFCGKNIADRYDMTVVSIVGEPEDLFGYEEGILVPGKRYDEFTKEHPDAHPGGGVDANYTMRGLESEREVSLEFFDKDGRILISQNGGVRVQGAAARLNNHKSLRLYARSEYDENNKFKYDLFEDLNSDADGSMGQEYKRLLLHNAGQDYGYGFIRTQLAGRLADQAGFPDTQHSRPACVYINGEYYGAFWLCNEFDRKYFEDRYGEYDGEFIVLAGGDRVKLASEDADSAERRQVSGFNEQYARFADMDLTVEDNYRQLQEFMDVENYLEYFAIENYIGNFDWPDGNVKVYRYDAGTGGYGEDAFDGRYRMILFDADYGFELLFYHETIGTLVNTMTLDKIMNESSPLFAALMRREDCREYFVSYTLDLMNGAMSAENVAEQVDKLHASRKDELSRMLSVEGLVGGLLLDEGQASMETVEWNVERIKAFAEHRPEYVLQDIAETFDYSSEYKLKVTCSSTADSVKVNSIYCKELEGTYLEEVPVVITPLPGPNAEFAGFKVNGIYIEEKTLILTGEDVLNGAVQVELLTKEIEEPELYIASLSAKGNEDHVELINLSGQTLSTEGYYLSDGDNPYLYTVPTQVLKPGESIRMVGRNNSNPDSLGQFALNFDLKEGEILTLYHRMELVDEVTIPDLSGDGIYVKDFGRGRFIEHKKQEKP